MSRSQGGMLFVSATVFAFGVCFFWPTMLAVVGDRFPRSGAVAMSIMGGIGMLSAGLIGGPGLGYSKDRYAAETLKETNPAVYETVKAAAPSKFLFLEPVNAIDGSKLAAAKEAKTPTPEQKAIVEADRTGDRKTLKADSFIPAVMAVIFLGVLLYFKAIGGYKVLKIEEQEKAA
jgi:MFS family permease